MLPIIMDFLIGGVASILIWKTTRIHKINSETAIKKRKDDLFLIRWEFYQKALEIWWIGGYYYERRHIKLMRIKIEISKQQKTDGDIEDACLPEGIQFWEATLNDEERDFNGRFPDHNEVTSDIYGLIERGRLLFGDEMRKYLSNLNKMEIEDSNLINYDNTFKQKFDPFLLLD